MAREPGDEITFVFREYVTDFPLPSKVRLFDMTWIRFLPLLTLAACMHTGQRGPENAPQPEIRTAAIQSHVQILAHDSMRGRATPSPELQQAADYVAAHLDEAGLEPVLATHLIHSYPVLALVRDTAATTLSPGSRTERFGDGFLTRGGATGRDGIRAGVVVLHGDPEAGAELAEDAVGDRIVLLVLPPPRTGITRAFWDAIGALPTAPKAILVLSESTDEAWAARIGREMAPTGAVPADTAMASLSAPVAEIRVAAARRLLGGAFDLDGILDSIDTPLATSPVPGLTLELRAPMRVVERRSAPNVAALLPGSGDPDLQPVVLSAHLDHLGVDSDGVVYNGADDNASGVAVLLEVARVAASLPRNRRPARPLLFLFPSGEEHGLWGTRAFLERVDSASLGIMANLNLDMLGRNASDTVHLVGEEASDLGQWIRRSLAREDSLHLAGDAWPDAGFFERSDQAAFHEHGVPALYIFAGPHDDYHQTTDDPETLDYGKLRRVARLILRSTLLLADSPVGPSQR